MPNTSASVPGILQVPELGQLSQQLANKYGKEFAASAVGDETCRFVQVNEKLIEYLSVYPPSGQVKLDLLAEVRWVPPPPVPASPSLTFSFPHPL